MEERSQECHTIFISIDTYIAQTMSLMTMTDWSLFSKKMGRLEIHSNVDDDTTGKTTECDKAAQQPTPARTSEHFILHMKT